MKRQKIAALTTLALILASLGGVFVQGQPPEVSAKLVEQADLVEQQIRTLIDLVYSNETALQAIEEFDLTEQLEGNVSLFDEGVVNLDMAHDALEVAEYEVAFDYAKEALGAFREAFSSIHTILCDAGVQKCTLIDSQGLLEAVARALNKISNLRGVLTADSTEALGLLDQAEGYLNLNVARQMLLAGNADQVVSKLSSATQLISQVYAYLKTQAEENNAWRINNYCERILERAQERFSYGNQQGINAIDYLQPLGYQSEAQFMEALQTTTQLAQRQSEFTQDAIQLLETAEQMLQQMNQALETEINRRQGGTGNGGTGEGGNGSGQGYIGP